MDPPSPVCILERILLMTRAGSNFSDRLSTLATYRLSTAIPWQSSYPGGGSVQLSMASTSTMEASQEEGSMASRVLPELTLLMSSRPVSTSPSVTLVSPLVLSVMLVIAVPAVSGFPPTPTTDCFLGVATQSGAWPTLQSDTCILPPVGAGAGEMAVALLLFPRKLPPLGLTVILPELSESKALEASIFSSHSSGEDHIIICTLGSTKNPTVDTMTAL
mmetsp:Transcript_3271/g.4783  ORF Transcript_3271/g.4783 Transcript_3271/m.4783 type:complete len:218 (+) Transcript_3271:651-1304(+)